MNVLQNPFIISDQQKASISKETLDLLEKCFQKDPKLRIKMFDIRRHPCFHFLPGFSQKYKGEFYRYDSGAVYEGEMKDGKFNGKGTYRYPLGGVYEGDWVGDIKHGTKKKVLSLKIFRQGNFQIR